MGMKTRSRENSHRRSSVSGSKRAGGIPGDWSVVGGVVDREIGGVEAEARGGIEGIRIGVEGVAEDRVAERGEMKPDLVGAAGDGFDIEARLVGGAIK